MYISQWPVGTSERPLTLTLTLPLTLPLTRLQGGTGIAPADGARRRATRHWQQRFYFWSVSTDPSSAWNLSLAGDVQQAAGDGRIVAAPTGALPPPRAGGAAPAWATNNYADAEWAAPVHVQASDTHAS